ncbi:MAG TPA: electron transfer flavoprotein subunit alpha/FixB family protein [Longimicrobiales bacterium]|nr:electron transfer flavoprotein subunit alpha/FixB family protein [Longimicrobiales bacterium]
MPDILVFVEQREGRLVGSAHEVVSVAARVAEGLGGSVHALLLGAPGASAVAEELGSSGASSVLVGEHEALAEYNPDGYADVVVARVRSGGYGVVLFSATSLGKDLAPRVAASLDVPLATDVTDLRVDEGRLRIVRPVYAGKAFATLELDATPAVASLRPNVFPRVEKPAEGVVSTFTPSVDPSSWRVRVVERRQASEGALDVSEAAVIVSGGRGMKDPSNWHLLEELKRALGSDVALGASRAVVDAGWRPHAEQVGQTGKTVSPKLYIAVGISGAVQHLAGMRTAETIVAINRDADAPIFNVADYGIVGDLFEVLPRLTEQIAALRGGA